MDDYHRYDREERKELPFTPLHPDCNYVETMEQHLQLLAVGQPVLKPVYDHSSGRLVRPELVEPRDFVIAEGLLPLHSKLARACFDVTVFLDPLESLRQRWKVKRDTAERGYEQSEVLAELERREAESERFIRPQRAHAAVVVRFAPIEERGETLDDPPSAMLLLRPTIPQPDLSGVLGEDTREAVHLKLIRDEDGKPVDALHVHHHAPRPLIRRVEDAIWDSLGVDWEMPETLGTLSDGSRSEPLALTQLIILYHILRASPVVPDPDELIGVPRVNRPSPAPTGGATDG